MIATHFMRGGLISDSVNVIMGDIHLRAIY